MCNADSRYVKIIFTIGLLIICYCISLLRYLSIVKNQNLKHKIDIFTYEYVKILNTYIKPKGEDTYE